MGSRVFKVLVLGKASAEVAVDVAVNVAVVSLGRAVRRVHVASKHIAFTMDSDDY